MSLLETAKRIFTGREERELENARVIPHGVPPIPEYSLNTAKWRQPMIPKIIGYKIKEYDQGISFYWHKSCQGYVDRLKDAGVFTVRDLKASGIDKALRHSVNTKKRLRLIPVYEKESDHEKT